MKPLSPVVVIDCNVIISQLLEDESNNYADAAFDWIASQPNVRLICPAIWPLEVQNTLLVAMRRKRCTRDDINDWMRELSNMPVTLEGSTALFDAEVLEIAEQHGLSVYDASYIVLARRHQATLITLDNAMARAAKALGIAEYKSAS